MTFTLTKRHYLSTLLNTLLLASLLLSVLAWCDYANRGQILAFAQKKYGGDGRERIADWYALIDELQAQPTEQKLKGVNRFFNNIRWMPDEEHWAMRDYWATPVELLGTDGGDCEDFAIAKYFSLMELGVEESKLRITYVIATRQNQAHMVLAYYATPDAEPLILDNLKDKVSPASSRSDLRPVYSFNGSGLWLAKERNSNLPAHNNNLTTWQSVNQRILKEMNAMQAFFLLSPYWLRRRKWRRGAIHRAPK